MRFAPYSIAMRPAVKSILERVAAWPVEDHEELSELAREIEARRTDVYRLSEEERAAIDAARRASLASDDEVEAFWKRHGLANHLSVCHPGNDAERDVVRDP